jgi:hypothetical protein
MATKYCSKHTCDCVKDYKDDPPRRDCWNCGRSECLGEYHVGLILDYGRETCVCWD